MRLTAPPLYVRFTKRAPFRLATPPTVLRQVSAYIRRPVLICPKARVVLLYKAYFQDGFEFNKGGKMPGFYGGVNDAIATTCSGGNHGENKCWSARMMFVTLCCGLLHRILTCRIGAGSVRKRWRALCILPTV